MAGRAGQPLAATKAFWDSSALVPLCAWQLTTAQTIGYYATYDVVIWWATPVEISSALSRLVRMRNIGVDEHAVARKRAERLAESWYVIQPSVTLRNNAAGLVEQYDLRAADSLQLAAALEWCEGTPQNQIFLSADRKLAEAARLTGFDVHQI